MAKRRKKKEDPVAALVGLVVVGWARHIRNYQIISRSGYCIDFNVRDRYRRYDHDLNSGA